MPGKQSAQSGISEPIVPPFCAMWSKTASARDCPPLDDTAKPWRKEDGSERIAPEFNKPYQVVPSSESSVVSSPVAEARLIRTYMGKVNAAWARDIVAAPALGRAVTYISPDGSTEA